MSPARIALVILCLLTAACAHTRGPGGTVVGGTREPWDLDTGEYPTQRLFRVTYDGPEGRGAFKLTLRLASPESFQLSAADTLGRALWSLELARGAALLVDHRQHAYCRYGGDLRIPEVALAPLPLAALPRVLLGRLPEPPAGRSPRSAAALDYRDRGGRRWTATVRAGEVRSWTLWRDDRPVLWWSAQPGGGLLSHRQGVQLRWRQSVREPLPGSLVPLTIPEGFEAGSCDEPDLS